MESVFECTKCCMMFFFEDSLKVHNEEFHKPGGLVCALCRNGGFQDEEALGKHVE